MAGYYSYSAILRIHSNYTPDDTSNVYNSGTYYGEQGASYTVYTNTPVTPPFTREGYDFVNYNNVAQGTGASYAKGQAVPFYFSGSGNQIIDLYCQWRLKTYTISFNANGGTGAPSSVTKTHGTDITLPATEPTRTNYIFQGWSTSASGSVEYQPSDTFSVNADTVLYAIWRIAGATLTSVTTTQVGSSGTASWNVVNASHTYRLVLAYQTAPTVTVNVAANTSSTSFTIPTTWYAHIPNSTSVTATASLTTFEGSTELVTSTMNFTVEIPANVVPTISSFTASPYSTNATISSWNVYVQGFSQVDLSATVTAGTGATLVSLAFSGDGVSQSSTATTVRSTVFDTTGSKTYTLIVTDSRGRTASSTVSITVLAYSVPGVSSLATYRCLSDGTQSDTDGAYLHSVPVFSFASVGGNNSLTVAKIEYKPHSGSTWTSGVTPVTSGTGYTYGSGGVNIAYTYDVKLTITDALGNSASLSVIVPPVVGFAVGLNNDRARFGGPVEEAGLVCDWDFKLKGDFIMDDGNGNTATMTYADLVSLLSGGGGGGVNVQQNLDGGLSLS